MTDDLVKRLRYEQDKLDDEAADRIEQLEAALQRANASLEYYERKFYLGTDRIEALEQALHEIASNNFLHLTWHSTAPMPLKRYKENCEAMVKIARAALGEKKDGMD